MSSNSSRTSEPSKSATTMIHVRQRALRAAAAVTGRAQDAPMPNTVVPVWSSRLVGLGVVMQVCACGAQTKATQQPTQEQPADTAPTKTTAQTQISSKVKQCTLDPKNYDAHYACCQASNFKAEGCTICKNDSKNPSNRACMSYCYMLRPKSKDFNYMTCCSEMYTRDNPNAKGNEAGMACTPWGPPAPPSFGGVSLDEWMNAPVAIVV